MYVHRHTIECHEASVCPTIWDTIDEYGEHHKPGTGTTTTRKKEKKKNAEKKNGKVIWGYRRLNSVDQRTSSYSFVGWMGLALRGFYLMLQLVVEVCRKGRLLLLSYTDKKWP